MNMKPEYRELPGKWMCAQPTAEVPRRIIFISFPSNSLNLSKYKGSVNLSIKKISSSEQSRNSISVFIVIRYFSYRSRQSQDCLDMPWDNSLNKNVHIYAGAATALVEQVPVAETVEWAALIIPSQFYCFQKSSALGCIF